MNSHEIEQVVEQVFNGTTESSLLSHVDCVRQLLDNTLIQKALANQLSSVSTRTMNHSSAVTRIQPITEQAKRKNGRLVAWFTPTTTTTNDDESRDVFDNLMDDEEAEDEEAEDDDEEEDESAIARVYRGWQTYVNNFGRTRLEDDSDLSTEISSVMLTPLVKVPVL